MLKNYFTTAIRNILKNKLFSIINILGLSIGIAACMLISHYVQYELSYDQTNSSTQKTYRVLYERESENGEKVEFCSASPAIGPALAEHVPEIDKYARIYKQEGIVSFEDIQFREENMFYAEPLFLEMFSYKILSKEGDNFMQAPNTAILSKKTARKYFGDEDPLGKTIKLNGNANFKVIGIFEDKPENTHYKANIFLSYKTWDNVLGDMGVSAWFYSGFYTYVQLKNGVSREFLDNKMTEIVQSEIGSVLEQYKMKMAYRLQPVEDIHLTSHFMHELGVNGNKNSVIFLYIIAWFIIVIAWINFINLLTIRSMKRSGEINLKKVLGSSKRQLIFQFILESLIINIIALVIGIILLELFIPSFSNVSGISSEFGIWNKMWFWKFITIIFLLGTLLAGSYPIIGVLKQKITNALKGEYTGSRKAIYLRKALVIFQFSMATILISGTISVYLQLGYMQKKETGINKENIFNVRVPMVGDSTLMGKRSSFKREIEKLPYISHASYSTVIPGKHNVFNRGGIRRVGTDPTEGKNYRITETDHHFMDVYKTEFIAGRNFSEDHPSDARAIIINEMSLKLLGFEDAESAINERVLIRNIENTVIGVIKNFHQESARSDFDPQIFRLHQGFPGGYFSFKYNTDNLESVQKSIGGVYKEFFPGNPYEYFFLDDLYYQQYKTEIRFGKVFGTFSLLGIFITILGILSLSSFSAQQRKKEIGIRKVLGASVKQILVLLSQNYIILLIIAFSVSIPVIIYALQKWLDNFANRMTISPWIFIVPIIVVTVLSLITVSYQSLKTARDNPVNSIRYE